ncbi:MAG: ribose-phosphate diphosphokinase [Methanomicrobiaceae archaeon]|nr:ribose-phosphate diphosphokinase [Methanomicrobiaceae archaeon]
MKVVTTEKSQVLGVKLAEALDLEIVDTRFSRFPDGELYLRTGDLDGETILVGSVMDSDSLVQLLLLIDACEGSENTLVLPYLGYARQDKKFHEGEPISARAIARALSPGVARVVCVNIHEESVLDHFQVPARNLSLAPAIGEYIAAMPLADPLILAPDAGASAFAAAVAGVGGWNCDELQKTRLSGEEVRITPKSIDAAGREVVIVDDIISTGGTLAMAASMLLAQGAGVVHAACVHGVFTGGAYTRLRHAGVQSVVASDTIEGGASLITAAACIAPALEHA